MSPCGGGLVGCFGKGLTFSSISSRARGVDPEEQRFAEIAAGLAPGKLIGLVARQAVADRYFAALLLACADRLDPGTGDIRGDAGGRGSSAAQPNVAGDDDRGTCPDDPTVRRLLWLYPWQWQPAEVEAFQPRRWALSYDELQMLFDAADDRVGQIRDRRRQGSLPALRDAVAVGTIYAFGLRRREAAMPDVADWRRNPRAAQYGRFGAVHVRSGKAVNGSPPRRRTVLTVPEMDWIVEESPP